MERKTVDKQSCFGRKLLVNLILFSAMGYTADFAFAVNSSERLQRSLGGITIGLSIKEFRKLSGWEEITGTEKQVFLTVFTDERLYSKRFEDMTLVCGLIRDRVYKVGMIVLPKDGKSLLTDYKQKYGSFRSVPAETWFWEDDVTILEVFPHEKYFNIVITDKELFALANSDEKIYQGNRARKVSLLPKENIALNKLPNDIEAGMREIVKGNINYNNVRATSSVWFDACKVASSEILFKIALDKPNYNENIKERIELFSNYFKEAMYSLASGDLSNSRKMTASAKGVLDDIKEMEVQSTLRHYLGLLDVLAALAQNTKGQSSKLPLAILNEIKNSQETPEWYHMRSLLAIRAGEFLAADHYLTKAEKLNKKREALVLEWISYGLQLDVNITEAMNILCRSTRKLLK